MKKSKPQGNPAILEHLSLTLTRINQDASGKQTINRTYWSTRKKVNEPDKNISHLVSKDSQTAARKTQRGIKTKESQVKGFVQMSLFPH